MTGALRHKLRHPLHNVTRWGLGYPHFVCLDDGKEWLMSGWWQRRLAR